MNKVEYVRAQGAVVAVWSSDKLGPLPVTWWAVIGLIIVAGLIGLGNGALNKVYRPVDGLVLGVVGRMGSGKSLLIVQRVLLPYCRLLAKRGYVMSQSRRPMVRAITNFRFHPGVDGVEIRNVQPTADRSIFASLIELAYELGAVEGPWYDAEGILHDGSEPVPEDGVPALLHDGKLTYTRQPILNALVVLDEMHLFAGSSKLSLGEEAAWIISMARKLNCELWWCSQHEMKVHKRLRDESSSIWLAGKLGGWASVLIGGGWHVAREYHSPALVDRARNALGTSGAPKASDQRIYRFTRATKRFYNSFELLVPDPPARGRGAGARAGAPRLAAVPDYDAEEPRPA